MDMKLEVFTPPGSGMSIIFGRGITDSAPGSVQNPHLVVTDIVAAREELTGRGLELSEVWHDFEDPDGNGWFLQEIVNRLPGR